MEAKPESKLLRWRKNSGLKIKDILVRVGCSRPTWHSWETGSNIPSPSFMPVVVSLTEGAVTANDFYDLPEREQAA